ncbi:MAG: hypothetical protein RLZZ230_396 [Candidatus Parcubacteria bacterium]|jgi:hypothetical protein
MDESIGFRTILKVTGITIGLLCVMAYVTFQARFLITGPQITVTNEPNTQQNERRIYLAGSTHNISHLWLNDRPIYTNAEGEFNEALVLENGYTIATLRAEDRYGRETTVVQPLVYIPASFDK